MSMFSTRNAQYSCTSVGVLRVTSMKARAGFASHGLPEVSIAAIATPATRLPTMVNRHSKRGQRAAHQSRADRRPAGSCS
jgi:hypothetical protein